MEMFSRVLRRGKPEEVFFIGRRKSISACADITLALNNISLTIVIDTLLERLSMSRSPKII